MMQSNIIIQQKQICQIYSRWSILISGCHGDMPDTWVYI